jgi:hypothetical protein
MAERNRVSAPPSPGGARSKRDADYPENRRAQHHLEPEGEGKFAAKSSDWHENRFFFGPDKLEVVVKNGRWG